MKWAGGHTEKVDVPSIDKTMTIIEGQGRQSSSDQMPVPDHSYSIQLTWLRLSTR